MRSGLFRRLDDVVVIDTSKGLLRAGFPDRGAKRADRGIDGPLGGVGRKPVEVDDGIGELGVRWQRSSRRRDNALDSRVPHRHAQDLTADEPRRTDEQQLHGRIL